jgi:mannonate dehydratase
MKIRDIKVIVASPGRNFVTVKIMTDEGLYGIGDATVNGREKAVVAYLEEHVIPCLIGRDPAQIEDIWQYLYKGAYWRRGPITMAAISGIDMALWDILGKVTGQPISRLLGGRYRETIRPYGSLLMTEPDDMAEPLIAAKERGFRSFKIGWGPFGRRDAATDEAIVKAARKAIGDECELMVDAGGSDGFWPHGYKWAINAARMLAHYNVTW